MKQPKCKICKIEYFKSKSTQTVCGLKCAIILSKRKSEKIQLIASKQEKKATRTKLEVLNWSKRSYCEKKLEEVINLIVREIDKGCSCISCRTLNAKWNAGHFHSVGASPKLRYNLLNIWQQCFTCNHHKSANIHKYDKKLIKLLGSEKWEYLKFNMPQEKAVRKTSIHEFPELVAKCREILKEVKEIKPNLSPIERWDIRVELNKRIGIY